MEAHTKHQKTARVAVMIPKSIRKDSWKSYPIKLDIQSCLLYSECYVFAG